MSIEFERCDDCNAMILMTDIPSGSHIECDECGAEYKIREVWDGDEEIYHRWLEQIVGNPVWL
jgi:DNA-directed RNA polymerase subunit M/transcription elongation factor TFIIS